MDPTETTTPPAGGPFRRALARRWRSIFALWFVSAGALGYLCYREFPPLYRASSLLRVSPSETDLYNIRGHSELLDQFLNTQVQLITSPNVLTAAGTNTKAVRLPRIQQAGDVVLELRKLIQVAILPNTYLIEVSMSSPDAAEAAVLVNAVVDAFAESSSEWSEGMTRNQITNLENYLGDLKAQSEEKERRWKELVIKGNASIVAGPGFLPEQAKLDARRVENDLNRLDAQSRLDALEQLVVEKVIAEADAAPQRVELLTRVRAADLFRKGLDARVPQINKRGGSSTDGVEISLLQESRQALVEMQEQVQKRLEQLKFEARGEARVRAVNVAVPPGKPISSSRLMVALAIVPVASFLLSLGLVGAFEELASFGRRRPIDEELDPI